MVPQQNYISVYEEYLSRNISMCKLHYFYTWALLILTVMRAPCYVHTYYTIKIIAYVNCTMSEKIIIFHFVRIVKAKLRKPREEQLNDCALCYI